MSSRSVAPSPELERGEPSESKSVSKRWLSPLARVTPASIVGLTLFCTIAVVLLTRPLADPDLWWHLKTGELIVSKGAIPRADPFSFTVPGKPWVAHEWASEVLLYWIATAFGLRSLIVWRALMLLLLYALAARLLLKEAGNRFGTWGFIALVAYGGAGSWTERPNLFSFLLFVITLTLVRRRDRSAWLFVPIAAIWANLHGMFLLGVGLVALLAVSEWLKVAFRWEGLDARYARRLTLVGVAGLLASFVNPYGPGLHLYSLRLVRTATPYITEWESPNFHAADALFFLLLVLLTLAGLSLAPRRPDPTDVALFVAFLTLGLFAWRNLALSAIVLGLVAARYFPKALAAAMIHRTRRPRRDVGIVAAAALNVAALLVVVAVFTTLIARDFPRSESLEKVIEETYPVATLAGLREPGTRLFTHAHWAGLALYLRWPDLRTAIDGRVDLYGADFLDTYLETRGAQPGWEARLRKDCVTHVLLDDREVLAVALRNESDWMLVSEELIRPEQISDRRLGDRAVTYVPKAPLRRCLNTVER